MSDSFEGSNAALLDALLLKLNLKTDAELCRAVNMQPSAISKLRTDSMPIGAKVLLRFHEVSGISIRELKSYLPEEHWSARHGFRKASTNKHVDLEAIARADEISENVIDRLRVERLIRYARTARAGDFGKLSTAEKLAAAFVLNRSDWIAALSVTLPQAIATVGKGYISAVPMAAKLLKDEELAELTKGGSGY